MASSEHPFPNEIPSRHPLPSGFKLVPDARSTTLPVTPVIPPPVQNGDVITSLHENLSLQTLTDLWTNEQWLAAQSFTDPTTTKGDLLARGASALTRLGVGAAGQVLTVDSAQPLGVKWAAPAGAVASVFGRTGVVVAASNDYSAAQVTNAVSVLGAYADPSWITSLAYSKLTGVPAAVPTTRQVIAGAGLSGGGALSADVTLAALGMNPSGAGHRGGTVPTPGAAAGATRYLREDATWAIPAGAGGGLTDPTTTKGDLLARGASAVTRLGVGTDGQVLTADAAQALGVKWAAPAAGGAAQTPWTSNINAATFALYSVGSIAVGTGVMGVAPVNVETTAYTSAGFRHRDLSPLATPGIVMLNDSSYAAGLVFGGSNAAAVPLRSVLSLYTQNSSGVPIVFSPGEVERMRITPAGLVGIGKTPATYKLEVNGDCDITGVYRVNGVPISTGGAQTPWTSNIDGGNFWLTNVASILTGPIGIARGGNAPSSMIHIGNAAGGTGAPSYRGTLILEEYSPTLAATMGIEFLTRGDSGGSGWRISSLGPQTDLVFESRVGPTWVRNLAITAVAGNVGIGTTAPGTQLHMSRTVASGVGPLIRLENSALAGGDAASIEFVDGSLRSQLKFSVESAPWGGDLIYTAGDGTQTERFRVTSSGNVGIGVTSPQRAIDIYSFSTAQLRFSGGGGTYYFEMGRDNVTTGDFFIARAIGGAAIKDFAIAGASGNVGIGTTNTGAAKLSVEAGVDHVLAIRGDHASFGLPATLGPILQGVNSAQNATAPITFFATGMYFMGGQVGIATTTPGAYALGIVGSVNVSGGYYINGLQTSQIITRTAGGRALSTLYQNTTGKPIFVSVYGQLAAGAYMRLVSDAVTTPTSVVDNVTNVFTGTAGFSVGGWVLAAHYYRIDTSGTTLTSWLEWS